MNILLVSSYLPYPLFSGGNIRLYNLIKRLSTKHSITLVCEIRDYQTKKDVDEVKIFCKNVFTVPRKKQWSIENIAKTGFSTNPFLITGHTSLEMQKIISKQLSSEKFDLIHVETFYVAQNLPKTDVPVVLIEHNIEYSIYQRFVDTTSLPLRPLLSLDVRKLKKSEENAWRKANQLIAVSNQEKDIMLQYNNSIAVVPNGVDIEQFKMKNLSERKKNQVKKILFIGDFSYVQNIDAVTFILQDIAPILRSMLKDVELQFWIKGRKIPESIKHLSSEADVMYDENSKTATVDIFSQAELLLAPIRIGAGTQYKILEAMAVGTPVVTTHLGNEGINAKVNKEILVAEGAEAIAEQIKKIVEDNNLYETIARNARLLIEKNFTWEKISQELDSIYTTVVTKI